MSAPHPSRRAVYSVAKSVTLAAGATALPDVDQNNNTYVITGDAGANTVATMAGGAAGLVVHLLFVDALVTVTDTNAATADTINLNAAFTSAAGAVLTLIHNGTKWFEVSRSKITEFSGGSISSALIAPAGTVAAPGLALSDANDGFYEVSDGVIGVSCAGGNALTVSATATTVPATSMLRNTAAATTLGAGVATFAVTSSKHTITGDAGGNTISTITGGALGDELTLRFADALVTITDTDATTADTVNLRGPFTSTAGALLQLFHNGTQWFEVHRQQHEYPVLYTSGVITSAQITGTGAQTLNHADGVTVIAAPGAGKYVRVLDCTMFNDYDTAGYANGSTTGLYYTDLGSQPIAAGVGTAFIQATADYGARLGGESGAGWLDSGNDGIANSAVKMWCSSTDITNPGTAAGVFRYEIWYQIIPTSILA